MPPKQQRESVPTPTTTSSRGNNAPPAGIVPNRLKIIQLLGCLAVVAAWLLGRGGSGGSSSSHIASKDAFHRGTFPSHITLSDNQLIVPMPLPIHTRFRQLSVVRAKSVLPSSPPETSETQSRSAYAQLARTQRMPVLMNETLADQWTARKEWDLRSGNLTKTLKQVKVYRQSQNRRFFTTFHDNKPMEPLLATKRWQDYNAQVAVAPSVVLKDNTDGVFLYFTSAIDLLKERETLLRDLQGLEQLQVSDEGRVSNLWIGRRGIVTSTHYDATFNFFVQLRGRKRFTLLPPSTSMYLYPCLHPHYGHAQVNISSLNPQAELVNFPGFARAEVYTAELGPGDMLYLPPFWFHQVETLEPDSLSVNAWSDAPEYSVMLDVYSMPVPFESHWSQTGTVFAAMLLISKLVEDVHAQHSLHWFAPAPAADTAAPVARFMAMLVEQRYRRLYASGEMLQNATLYSQVEGTCASVLTASHIQTSATLLYRQLLEWDTGLSSPDVLNGELDPARLASAVAALSNAFGKIADSAIRTTLFMNYIEHLVNAVLGAASVHPFFVNCFLLVQ
ncbi:hypothetical protein CAOG_02325 [Capsaspora owczarzaki ATCC 30864]|uniref:JmjC domain-containing protein n=1 Tax=Capsaspora owczarzaki (strain ATCC 30864) TaxID=595528 RepID=A0A0D2U7T9_CAPO3|nr:hypothetical protein CAOG_02325 [Capsaspora owczarzaki ATCC 30864]KJE91146.1 hypothetical protein CAOG_002325 [Capsaspora owczarzaki ATCC 30864]|eukprot:XP_004349075.2 hypothetical protein CAOG_02325 [Capsaspora owczarzaki ATCC 30864]